MSIWNHCAVRGIRKAIFYVTLLLISMTILVPLYSVVLNSFKNLTESAVITLDFPKIWLFENYLTVIKEGHILRAMGNGLLITVASVTAIVLFASIATFILVRRDDKSSRFIFYLLLIGMMAPISIIPEIKIMQLFGIYGSLISMIIIHVTINLPFSVFLYSGFIQGIPKELDEAAIVDGCGPVRTFFQVVFPSLKPVVFTNIIVVFMAVWNDFQYSLYFLTKPQMYTMPLTVYAFKGYYTQSLNLLCGDLVLTVIPVLVVYLFAQKYIISGMMAGAVKG